MKTFKRIFIEISNHCNLSCSFCPPSHRDKRAMKVREFETVLQKLKGHGDHVYLHVKGEPLFHAHFPDILDLCERYGKKVNITTNGTLLHKHGDTILENSSVRLVNISLQSFEKDNRHAYETYLQDVLAFVKKGLSETNKLFELRLWNIEEVVQEAEKPWTLAYIEEALGMHIPITKQNTKGLKGKSNVYISKGVAFEWPSMDNDYVGETGNCYGLRRQIAILSTGDVVPCCLDAEGNITLGNIFEMDFEQIVTSPRASSIARGFENRKIVEPLCRHCSYREQFV